MESRMMLLDTGVLIAYFRAKDKSKTWLYELANKDEVSISVITEYEFRVGFQNQEDTFLAQILSFIDILAYDSLCVIKSVEIYQNLKKKNQLIPIQDILIAATALRYQLPLATLNTNHFGRIENLQLIDQSYA